jgi:hypothetical protein
MDITKCDNNICPLRKGCLRFTAIPNEYSQAWGHFEPFHKSVTKEKIEYECEMFLDNKSIKDETK